MNTEFHQDKTEFYTRGLLAVAVLLGALVLLQVAGFVAASSQSQAMAAQIDPNGGGVGDVGKLLASAKASAEELKKKNLFIVVPPKQHPVGDVLGILGDEALINGQWYKVGASVGDAKIVAIDPTKVRIAWDGQEKDFSPINSSGGGRPEQGGPPRPPDRPGPGGRPPTVASGPRGGPPGQAAGGLSPGERDRMREQWQNMSPEERQRAREEMRQKLGTRR